MTIFTTGAARTRADAPQSLSSSSRLSRTDPANLDLPVTEPIDITEVIRLLAE
jgi:hypothetical protein